MTKEQKLLEILVDTQRRTISLKESSEAILLLFDVVGQSEQLLAFKEWERDKCRLPWDAEPKEIVEQYLSQ